MSTKLPIASKQDVGGVKVGTDMIVGQDGAIDLSYSPYFRVDISGEYGAAQSTAGESIALGSGAQATYEMSIALGAKSKTKESHSVSVGDPDSHYLRKIQGVKDGEEASDAATWGQVQSLKSRPVYLSGSIFTSLNGSEGPILSWIVPQDFKLTNDCIRVTSLEKASTNGSLTLMYSSDPGKSISLPIASIGFYSGSWHVDSGVEPDVVSGGILWIKDTFTGDTGGLSIAIVAM